MSDLTLLEQLCDEGAAEVIYTVDDELVFLVHDQRATERILTKYLGLEYVGYHWFCPNHDLSRKLREARAAEGSAEKELCEDDDRLRLDQLVELLFDATDVGYDDEYECCDDCGRWVYTSPTSYCDSGRFTHSPGGDLTCRACCEKNADRHLDEYLEVQGNMAFILDPATLGFEQVNEDPFQNGLHHGMADDPKAQRRLLRKADIDQVIMTVEPSQFYVEWRVWVRPEHTGVARLLLTHNALFWRGSRGQRLVFTASAHIGDEVHAYYRESNATEWQVSRWTYGDEERWYMLWKTRSDKVFEFDYLTEETWNDRRCIALCRFGSYDPTETWEQVKVSLRQSPTPAERCERALRGLSSAGH